MKRVGGKAQQQESCNSAFFVKKQPTKQNKQKNNQTTQNIKQPEHRTGLLTTDIKESRNTRKKIHGGRRFVLQGSLMVFPLAEQLSQPLNCCANRTQTL